MAAVTHRNVSNPFLLPEIVALVIDNVHMVRDLLNCACVNSVWSAAALKKLYSGSINDMQFRTPDIGSLNCLFVASRKRFARNMSFVKHLLFSPETPAIDEAANPQTRLACFEKLRALRHRQYAELLFRPEGKGLASLTIPFEIMDQDWSFISDLLLPPTVEYLAIDNIYCEALMTHSGLDSVSSFSKYANLKAPTIYKTDIDQMVNPLCLLLKRCELHFFHFEEPNELRGPAQTNIAEILPYLQRQQYLETLALMTPRCDPNWASMSVNQNPWPNLKALYLREGHENWLEHLPKFENLQILRLRRLAPTYNGSAIKLISRCRNLRIVDLAFQDLADVEALLEIARGCPLLQKFKVDHIPFRGGQELFEHQFLGLLRALPNVEFFEVGLKFRMDGARLQDLARYCPHLISLNLPQARLHLSPLLLSKAHPLSNLETMCFSSVWFEKPKTLIQSDQMHDIVEEWYRIFPKLRALPCTADIYCMHSYTGDGEQTGDLHEHMTEDSDDMIEDSDDMIEDSDDMTEDLDDMIEDLDDMIEDSGRNMISVDLDADLSNEPGLDFDEFGSDWFIFRIKLWRALGYGEKHLIHEGFGHMWQTNMEIGILGWPVVPSEAFCDPAPYSTTAYRPR